MFKERGSERSCQGNPVIQDRIEEGHLVLTKYGRICLEEGLLAQADF